MNRKFSFLALPTIVLIAFLWLPFGLHMGPTIEEWGLLGLYGEHGPFFLASAHSLMPQHQMRPLIAAPWALAYLVDPNSWWFWHVELASMLLIKGAAFTSIAYYLVRSKKLSIIAGLLFVVWPADTLQMAFRAINIGFASGLSVASAALFICAYTTNSRYRQIAMSIIAAACLLIGAWMYELTILLAPLPFFVMYAREGLTAMMKLVRAGWRVSTAWLSGVVVGIGYVIAVFFMAKGTYQQSIAGNGHSVIEEVIGNTPMLVTHGFWRALVWGWIDAARIVVYDLKIPAYLIIAAIVFLSIALISKKTEEKVRGDRVLRVCVAGILAICIGYGPYLVYSGFLSTSQRTYMFAAIGAALIFFGIISAIDRINSYVASLVGVGLITLGLGQQLYQFNAYDALYESQRLVLSSIVRQIPDIPDGKTLIILDGSQRLNSDAMLDGLQTSALTYLYGKHIQSVKVCTTPENYWEFRNVLQQTGTCTQTTDDWVFKYPSATAGPTGDNATVSKPDLVISKANAIVVQVPQDLTTDAGAPLKNATAIHASVLAPRSWPLAMDLFGDRKVTDRRHWDFGHRWDIPESIAGAGWKNEEWAYAPLNPVSQNWINRSRASLVFDLRPADAPYTLGIVNINYGPSVKGNVSIRINGTDVPVVWATDLELSAQIPKGILRDGSNILEINAPASDKFYGISMLVDQIDLAPIQ
jgi:hypothetical protein